MGRMKKADQHAMYREDAIATTEALVSAGSGIEELVAMGMFAGMAADIFFITGEIELKTDIPPVAKDPGSQWAVDHREIVRNMLKVFQDLIGFDVAGFKPFAWMSFFAAFPIRWRGQLDQIRVDKKTGQRSFAALPWPDRLMFASFVPSLAYTLIKVIANIPRLVGDLLPG